MSRVACALLGSLFWIVGTQSTDAQSQPLLTTPEQWYKVPAGGQVNFNLNEFWSFGKGLPPSGFILGEATITLEYLDGSTQQIGFHDSSQMVNGFLINADGSAGGFADSLGATAYSGTMLLSQIASLTPGSEFQIVSSSPAQAFYEEVEFQGGSGAYVKGFVAKFSTDAPPVTPPSGQSTSTVSPPSAPGSAPSNIHAVIVSGLSDPAKVITSPNVILTGGIVALGKNGSTPLTSSAWSPGLKIIPDYALLTGAKIPPVIPNIIDVRIIRQEVSADFPSTSPKQNN